jgi:hypothetical protein
MVSKEKDLILRGRTEGKSFETVFAHCLVGLEGR